MTKRIFRVIEVDKLARVTSLEAVDAPTGFRHTLMWEYGVDDDFIIDRPGHGDVLGTEYEVTWTRL